MTTRTLTRRAASPARLNAASIIGDAITLVVGLSSSFTIHLVGELPVAEVILVILLPVFIILRGARLVRPGLKTVFYLMGLWLFGAILSDIYRATPAHDWTRGDATIVFFAIDIMGVAVLIGKNERRKVIFLVAFAIGALLAVRFQPSVLTDFWKFGYSTGTNLLVALISCYFFSRRQYAIAGLLLAGIMGVNLLFDFRSPVLFFLIAIVLALPVIPEQIGPLRILPRAGSAARVAVLAGLALAAVGSAYSVVHLASASGLLGDEAQAKDEGEARATGGVLLGGRPEILVSSRAVWDSPILGHGSWAKEVKYLEMLSDLQAEYGSGIDLNNAEELSEGVIPAHSHLMGAWIQAGILGAFLWFYLFFAAIKAIVRISVLQPACAPLYAFMLVGFSWDILFSPFGNTQRMLAAVATVIVVDLLERRVPGHEIWRRPRLARWSRLPARERQARSRRSVNFPS